jgi:hypothetical protein
MEKVTKDYLRVLIWGEVAIPDIIMQKEKSRQQASVNGLVLALAQSGVLPHEIRQLLGVPDNIPEWMLMNGTWIPTRQITLEELFEEIDRLE